MLSVHIYKAIRGRLYNSQLNWLWISISCFTDLYHSSWKPRESSIEDRLKNNKKTSGIYKLGVVTSKESMSSL